MYMCEEKLQSLLFASEKDALATSLSSVVRDPLVI